MKFIKKEKMSKKNKKEIKKFVFITCTFCGCETIANTWEILHMCEVCHQKFKRIFVRYKKNENTI